MITVVAKHLLKGSLSLLALIAIAAALWNLHLTSEGVHIEPVHIGVIPARVFRPVGQGSAPVIVIAHGFAGSQQLMQSFALAFARNGYAAVTFDFAGHGRNPLPLVGSITDETGATQTLISELTNVSRFAIGLGDGKLAVLGHSMASDIVVRYAKASPDVSATIAVSMFSPAVTATSPRNLLIIVGEWEGMLKEEALRAVGLAIAPDEAKPGVTYGEFELGTARRAAFSRQVEHASVLFSQASMREAVTWLDSAFGFARTGPLLIDPRGPWILTLLAGAVALAFPLSKCLPRISNPAARAALCWKDIWFPLFLPMLVTPLLLRVLPTHFLPVLVGDYLAAHFTIYGLLTIASLLWIRRSMKARRMQPMSPLRFGVASLLALLYVFIALVWPIDTYITSFWPGAERVLLIVALLVGTTLYFLSDELLTRGVGAAGGAYAVSKLAFLISLAVAIGLDFERLFFLMIVVPEMVLVFVVCGLFSSWSYWSTGQPLVGGVLSAVLVAWSIGVTFPLVTG